MKNKLSSRCSKSFVYLFIFIFFISPLLHAQDETITGTVTSSSDNKLLAGVSISRKGSTGGTITDTAGRFSITAPKGTVLVFSFVGYEAAEIIVGNTTALAITLDPVTLSMDQVVVVAYGKQQKKDLTGAVAVLSQNDIKNQAVAGIDQKLAGQVAGVQVADVTGAPGGGASVKIRGSGSIGAGDQPLFVIDGFALSTSFGQTSNPLNVLNPDDIESITILKDASSTAIYGSRGANGVVLITTRSSKAGAAKMDITAYTGFQQVLHKGRPDMMNGQEFAQFRKEMIIDEFAARGEVATDDDIPVEFRNPELYGAGTDWYDLILHTAPQTNINVSLTKSGDNNVRSAFSAGYFDQQGVVQYTNYKRYTARANIEGTLAKKLKIGLNLAPSYSTQKGNDYERDFVDILAFSQWLSPIIPAYTADNKRTAYILSPGMFGASNPLDWLQFAPGNRKLFRGLGGAFAEYEIFKSLRFKYSYNVDYSTEEYFRFDPSFLVAPFQAIPPDIPSSFTSRYSALNWLSEALLTYDKTIGADHKLNVVLGYTAQKEKSHLLGIDANDYPDDRVQTINAAARISTANDDIQEWALISYLARINYSFKNKYLLTATLRSDGSSRFGSNSRYGIFPSIGVGWNISDEKFMQSISWLTDLKLRGSYGLSGNFNIGNYTYISEIGSTNYVFGGQLSAGRVSTSLGNPDLTWEESKQIDLGIDVSLFNRRLGLVVDYYRRTTEGMLYNSEIPVSSGFSNAIINAGRILNTGVEISINSTNIKSAFTWSTNFNISFNKNKVLALNENNDPILSGRSGEGSFTHITQVGRPIGEFYGYVIEGVYINQADFDNSPKHATSVLGSIKYKDVDGNGIIEVVNDFAAIGNAQPDFIWGMTNNFSYKNVDLSILLTGSQGGQVYKKANQYLHNIDGVFNVTRDILNRWRSPEQPGDGKTPTTNGARVIYRDINSGDIENASFVRIRNITLGYQLPGPLLKKASVFKAARIYASVQNAFMFTQYSGANPDVSRNGSSVLEPGEDFTNYPIARSFTFGVNFSF